MIDGLGPVRVRQLLERFGDSTAILRASRSELQQVHGIGPEISEAIAHWEKTVDLSGELKRIEQSGCHIVLQSDENYPPLLRPTNNSQQLNSLDFQGFTDVLTGQGVKRYPNEGTTSHRRP